jgi:hypothetical protein
MGSILYDFLNESFLFKDDNIRNDYQCISENEIKKELRKYREFCLNSQVQLESEINCSPSTLRILSGKSKIPLNRLKQTALYVHQYILNDPLFALSHEEGEMSKAIKEYHKAEDILDKKHLSETIGYLKSITPMIAADFIKMLPISYFSEPSDKIPFLSSDNLFADVLPKNVLEYFHKNVKVESFQQEGNLFKLENKLYPCRSIFISFPKDKYEYERFYHLYEIEIKKVDKEKRTFEYTQHLPSTPPDQEQFMAWVVQSINQASKNIYDDILLENMLALRYNSSYLTDSHFAFELMQQRFEVKNSIPNHTVNLLMNFDLPFMEGINIDNIMKIRLEDGEAFNSFRINLEKHFKVLREINDEDTLKTKLDNAIHEINEVQLSEINNKINSLKKMATLDFTILLAGFAGTIQTGGYSLIASAYSLMKGIKTWSEYYDKVKNHPAFFYWKLKKSNAL